MAFSKKRDLPRNWPKLTKIVLARDDYRCTAILSNGNRCPLKATDVHHLGDRDDHRPEMLASSCPWHHKRETSKQGNAARNRVTSKIDREAHPGVL